MPRSVNACTDEFPKIPLRVKNVAYNTNKKVVTTSIIETERELPVLL